MIAVLRQRDFSLLWSGGILSVVGDFFLFVALPFFVYERTGSTLATGAMFAAQTMPRLLFGSVAGVFVDRWDGPIHARGGRYYLRLDAYADMWMLPPDNPTPPRAALCGLLRLFTSRLWRRTLGGLRGRCGRPWRLP
jgi:hypothetical protein